MDPTVHYRPHFAAFTKRSAASAASCRASYSECEKYFSTARESSELGCQCASGQILSTQQGFRVCSALSSSGPVWLLSLSASLARGLWSGPEGSRVHSAWNCCQSPPLRAWLLPTLAWPLHMRLFPAQPASLHFSSSSFGLLHFLPAQRLSSFPGLYPQCPPAHLQAPDIGTGLLGPLWLGPF